MSLVSVTNLYQQRLAERGYKADQAQLQGIQALQRCQNEWLVYLGQRKNPFTKLLLQPPLPRGVYMYGGVGRGKSFIMDCFYDAVPLKRKTRLHFHEFMREVHRQLHALKGIVNPLDELAKRMSRKHRLICFDEFHVADVTDAMILHRLLDAMFRQRMSIVTTSNFHPDDLYPHGLHRERIFPAIDLLKQKLEVMNVDSGSDYRRRALELVKWYLCPIESNTFSELTEIFEELAETSDQDPALNIENRLLTSLRCAGGVVWFDFQALCGSPQSQNDYLELAARFHTLILSNVPEMPVEMASQARRFTLLVDVLYDRKCKLVMSAEVPLDRLYTKGPMLHEFPRTVSRLLEMQSKEYIQQERRTVDTALT